MIFRNKRIDFLPPEFEDAHQLCVMNYQIMLEMLRSGERRKSYDSSVELRDDAERQSLEESDDILEWLGRVKRLDDRARVLKRIVFPAVLSDFLHFIYNALDASRNAALTVCFSLLRKPIQDNLSLMEVIATDVMKFAEHLSTEPPKLSSKQPGNSDNHFKRIELALKRMDEQARFDAKYLAQIRYDKKYAGGLSGICDRALHLFTHHEVVRTEPMNINMVFIGDEERWSQWNLLYSCLPYILVYSWLIFEHVFTSLDSSTDPAYLRDIHRRVAAGIIMWGNSMQPEDIADPIQHLIEKSRTLLNEECRVNSHRSFLDADLIHMRDDGKWPGQLNISIYKRLIKNKARYILNKHAKGICSLD